MKHFYLVVAISFLVLSCKEMIKNEVEFAEIQGFDEISFVKPKITNSLTVNSKDDLLGYWVGNFQANITQEEENTLYDSISDAESILYRKITFSIDEIIDNTILGHSIVAGNISPFKGTLKEDNSFFIIEADEFNKTNSDGKFSIHIAKFDSILKGNWKAYHPQKVKIANRKFNLNKRFFVYDKNSKLGITFMNSEKFNSIELTDTIDNEVEVYEDVEFYSTTDKLFLKNPSVDLLSSDFVSNLTKADIFILRNSIFARHGFAFRDKQLRMYFESYDWYMPVFGDVKDELTNIEKINIDLLLRYEQNAMEYYDTFGR